MRWLAGLVVAAFVAGCGDDVPSPGADAGADAGLAIVAPAAPAAVTMTPCPAGWTEVVGGGAVVCDPGPVRDPAECADDEAHFVGEPGCVRIGTECPPDGIPVLSPEVTAVYVLAEAATGGDGTRERPFRRISDASPSLRSGTVLALGRGTYTSRFRVPDGVTVRGACVAETRVTAPTATEGEPTLFVTAGAATISNLTVVDTGGPGVAASGAGVSLTVEDVIVRRARIGGLIALMDGSIAARNVLVDEMRPRADGTLGRCVDAEDGATVGLTRVVARRCRDIAIYAGGIGTSIAAAGVLVTDTQDGNGLGGRGVNVELGATGTLERSVVEGSHQAGIYVGASSATLTADHVVVRGTRAQVRDGQNGEGIIVELGGYVRASSITFETSDEGGIMVRDPDSLIELTDAVVRDTLGVTPPEASGFGIAAWQGGAVVGTRVLVERARTIGVGVIDASSSGFEDLVVRDVTPSEVTGAFGRGVDATRSSLRLRRALVERTRENGVLTTGEGATLDAEDLAVSDTTSNLAGGDVGIGLVIQFGATGRVTRGRFDRVQAGGVFVLGSGSRAELSEVSVRDVVRSPCAGSPRCPLPIAIGLASVNDAVVTASRFEVLRAGDCGVQVAASASLDLHDGLIASTGIGACVQTDGYDLSRLSRTVLYSDNGSNLDSTFLPVPMPMDALGPPVP